MDEPRALCLGAGGGVQRGTETQQGVLSKGSTQTLFRFRSVCPWGRKLSLFWAETLEVTSLSHGTPSPAQATPHPRNLTNY